MSEACIFILQFFTAAFVAFILGHICRKKCSHLKKMFRKLVK